MQFFFKVINLNHGDFSPHDSFNLLAMSYPTLQLCSKGRFIPIIHTTLFHNTV